MTFEELRARIARGEYIGEAIDLQDAVVAIVHELDRLRTARANTAESPEDAWEHSGEEHFERRNT